MTLAATHHPHPLTQGRGRDLHALLAMRPRPSWMEGPDLPCQTHGDPDLWFEAGCGKDARQRREEAITICGTCPMQQPCAEFGRGESSGIWGGVMREPVSRPGQYRRRKEQP